MNILKRFGMGLALLLITGRCLAQDGTMMEGGMWNSGWMGGRGGYWIPTLVLAIIVGLVIWMVKHKKK